LYASTTDYKAVYHDAYRDRRGSHTSFDIDLLPALLATFCREAGVANLLDVSGGQGRLAEALGQFGIRALTTDISAAPGRPIIPFDLSCYAEADTARIGQEIRQIWGDAPYVTCCLDVLEHIDREHVFAALRNLAGLCQRLLVVSISTRPSSADNLFHASILPVLTWVRLFRAAGFRLLPTSDFAPATRPVASDQTTGNPLVDRWRTVDLFGDISEGEPRYLVFERTTNTPDWAGVQITIEALLDIAYYREKRRQFSVPEQSRFLICLHHIQEFALLRPLLDVLPRDRLRVILRSQFVDDRHRRAITGFLARTGVRTQVFERADELPWPELTDHIFITAAESGCAINHVCGFQISALARLHRCRTYLLQHGIWPRAFQGRIATFGAEHVLNWGAAEEHILHQNKHRIGGVDVPWGMFGAGQPRRIGSPRYTDQLLPIHPDGLDLRFGVERHRFASVVLLATKNFGSRWGSSNFDDTYHSTILHLIESNPETLFLVRPHPAKGAEEFNALRRENVRFLDETCCIAADIPLSRVIPLVDRVVTPMSTIALDGAISDKPVIICDAGQPQMYNHLEAVPLEQLPQLLHDPKFLDGAVHRTRLFRNAYGEAVDARFYERFAGLLAEPTTSAWPRDAGLATAVSLTAEAELQWCEAQHARAWAAERTATLESEAAAARRETTMLAKEVETLRGQLEATQTALEHERDGVGRRVTAPLRRAVGAMRRLAAGRPGS
jgi:hypothetical protein